MELVLRINEKTNYRCLIAIVEPMTERNSENQTYLCSTILRYNERFEDALHRIGVENKSYSLTKVVERFYSENDIEYHEHVIVFELKNDEDNKVFGLNSTNVIPELMRDRRPGGDISYKLAEGYEFNVRVSAKITKDNTILLDTSYGDHGHTVPIGGRMGIDETITEAMVREVEEELSVTPDGMNFLGVSEDFFELENPDGTKKWIHFISFNFDVDVPVESILFADGCVGEWIDIDVFNAMQIKLESFKQHTKNDTLGCHRVNT